MNSSGDPILEITELLCQQFTEATGWKLDYTPVGAGERVSSVAHELRSATDCCWFSEVDDGQDTIGFLHLELPDNPGQDHAFVPMSGLAAALVQVLSRLATTSRGLASRTREVSTLVNVGISNQGEENLSQTLSALLAAAVQLTGYRSAAFFLLTPTTRQLRLRAVHLLQQDQLPSSPRDLKVNVPDMKALAEGLTFVERGDELGEWLPPEMACGLCVSVQSKSVPIGTLWIYDRRGHTLIHQESQLLQSIAGQIANCLERVVLLRESETQQRLVSELRVASESQGDYTADRQPTWPGFEASARCVSRHEVGGDLCELISISDHKTGIALGDASGNSIPAALVMTAVRGGLRALPGRRYGKEVHPAETMERLNESLHAITGPQQFMSLFFGVYDDQTHKLIYTNAGHPSPLLIRKNELIPLETHGLLLGVLSDVSYEHSELEIEAGDMLVVYSDGISEAMSESNELFRSEGIISSVRAADEETAACVLDSIWSRAERHASNPKYLDDRTLLVLRFGNVPACLMNV